MKMNKKGFTLAELLIVIAIMAVLIAIAIPVFAGQLDNAKLQADHANLRSAYAIMQTANLIEPTDAFGDSTVTTSSTLTYCTDGTFKTSGGTSISFQSNSHTGKSGSSVKESCKTCVVDCSKVTTTSSLTCKYASGEWGLYIGTDKIS